MIAYQLYTAPISAGGTQVYDFSNRVHDLTWSTNNRGVAEAQAFVPMGLAQAFELYDRSGLMVVYISDSGANVWFEGRLEDVHIVDGGVKLGAFGYARAMSDLPYTAFWSASGVQNWRAITETDIANRSPKMYTYDFQNRVFIGLTKNSVYANSANVGAAGYFLPDGSSTGMIGIAIDLEINLPTNWVTQVNKWGAGFSGGVTVISNTSGGTLQRFSYNTTLASGQIITLEIINGTGANYTMAGESGTFYVKATNIRMVATTANRISTTLTANATAGSNVALTVGSTARMYVGQLLTIDTGNFNSETVTITAVNSPTQVTVATLANNHVSTQPVNAHIVYGDEIVKDIQSTVIATNSTQLNSSTGLIQSPGLDLVDEVYEDRSMADILDYLIGLGDNQATPRQWEWGVKINRLLYFRPQSTTNNTWYIDVTSLDVDRSLDQLVNSWYATYKDASGRTLRTSAQTDANSVTRYGLTRRQAVNANTTSSTLATTEAAAALADSKDPKSRSGLTLTRIYDGSGNRVPLWFVQAGDTVVIRNLPPTLSAAIDKIRSFRLSRAEYHAADDTLAIEPEVPTPTLTTLIARLGVAQQSAKTPKSYTRFGGVIMG